jgi:hypothetical protein
VSKEWKVEVVENIVDENFDRDIVEQMLEEVAGVIYSDLCQLQINSLSRSFDKETNFLQRTGTDA